MAARRSTATATATVARRSGSYHHGDLRRALLDATLELVGQKGPEGFTLRAAAKLAGVSDAAPYHHFTDKEALLAAVAEEGYGELYIALESAARGHAQSPRDRARGLGVAYVLFAASHPSHFRVMVSRSLQQHARLPGLALAAGQAFQLVRDALLDAVGAEQAAELPSEQVIFGAWGLVHGLAFLAIDGHLGAIGEDPERLRELVDGVLGLFSRD
jgi:AcrR family transcriptional regulator